MSGRLVKLPGEAEGHREESEKKMKSMMCENGEVEENTESKVQTAARGHEDSGMKKSAHE
jgi:hypothetical protein